ncbi:MAG: type II secretion system protein [Planctomycetota bacterium]|jgi:prepilin-type N-terminal cleavage/methylation domain-containing protein
MQRQPAPPPIAARRVSGFSLIEVLIVMSILSILAALVLPSVMSAQDAGRKETMATNVRIIAATIESHAGSSAIALSASGYPLVLDQTWFAGGQLPLNPWSSRGLTIETVAGPADDRFPVVKTFDPSAAGQQDCWYNSGSGAFCARVPAQANDADTLSLFNEVNNVVAANLAATN